jgi:hypothetical protein
MNSEEKNEPAVDIIQWIAGNIATK